MRDKQEREGGGSEGESSKRSTLATPWEGTVTSLRTVLCGQCYQRDRCLFTHRDDKVQPRRSDAADLLHGAGPMQMAVPLQVGSFCYSPALSSWVQAGHSQSVSRCPPAGEEAPGSKNRWGLNTYRGQRRRDPVWITSKVPRAFPKEPHSHRSSETTEAEQ